MPIDWTLATDEMVETVTRIRATYHGDRLGGARIALLMRLEAPTSGGMATLGACSLWPAAYLPFGDYHFRIWFAEDEWRRMPQARRDALADHELCHAQWDTRKRKASLRPHDITEFYEVWRRHGPYLPAYDAQRETVQEAFDLPGLDEDVTEAFDPARMNGHRTVTLRGLQREADGLIHELRAMGNKEPEPEPTIAADVVDIIHKRGLLTRKPKRTPAAPIAAQVEE